MIPQRRGLPRLRPAIPECPQVCPATQDQRSRSDDQIHINSPVLAISDTSYIPVCPRATRSPFFGILFKGDSIATVSHTLRGRFPLTTPLPTFRVTNCGHGNIFFSFPRSLVVEW